MPKKPLFLAAFVPAALLAGCSASHPGVEPSAFASVACTTWLDKGSAETLSDSSTINGLSGTAQEQRNQAIALAEKVVAEWEKSRDTIAAAKPAVEDGPKIVALFTDNYNTRIDAANELIDEFRSESTETSGDEELARQGAEKLFLGIDDTAGEVEDPFIPIRDQQVVKAMLSDDVCSTFLDKRNW